MSRRPTSTFPRPLTRMWSLTAPSSETMRTSDALDHPTMHRLVKPDGGDYWVCSETGQLEHTVQVPPQPHEYDGHRIECILRRKA